MTPRIFGIFLKMSVDVHRSLLSGLKIISAVTQNNKITSKQNSCLAIMVKLSEIMHPNDLKWPYLYSAASKDDS